MSYGQNYISVQTSPVSGDIYHTGGNLGIGTTSPSQKLEVAGNIKAEGMWLTDELYIQNTEPWPDFVFEQNYDLMSIDTLAEYIEINKHLPDVPTANDIEQNGMPVKEMNTILLQKIEELTLYIIEQQKEIDELEKQLNNLK